MNTLARSKPRVAVPAVLTAALSLATLAGPAQAAPNPYTPQGVCGAGFGVIDHHELRSGALQLGTVYLLYNAASGRNCAVTMKEKGVGSKTPTMVFLQRQGGATKTDRGRFAYYAGPRRVNGRQTCVRWGGSIKVGARSAAYYSLFEHCA
jgi:hypothetical protein